MCFGSLPRKGQEKIYENTLRLHVLANSDSYHDQKLKLKIKDEITTLANSLFSDCDSIDKACVAAKNNLSYLQSYAQDIVRKEGFDYNVKVTLTKEQYPVRYYGNLTFPAGKYTSLRVLIGNAKGKNWWCVLFPPLCVNAATSYEDNSITDKELKMLKENYGTEAVNILTERSSDQKTVIKFKTLEILKKLGII